MMRHLVAALCCIAGPAAAEENLILLSTFDTTSSFAPPPWTTLLNTVSDSTIVTDEGQADLNARYIVQSYFPADQGPDEWQELYAIFVEAPVGGSTEIYRNGIIGTYADTCADLTHFLIENSPDQQFFMLACGSFRDEPDSGEFAIMHYRRAGSVIARNYYHLRSPAFDVSDRESWPIAPEELADLRLRLGQFTLHSTAEPATLPEN